jgi:hypothetical protein
MKIPIPKKSTLGIALVAFLIGAIGVRTIDLELVGRYREITESIRENSQQTYDVQVQLISNYEQSYNQLVECFLLDKVNCDRDKTVKKFQEIGLERDQLLTHLDKLNGQYDQIMSRVPKGE